MKTEIPGNNSLLPPSGKTWYWELEKVALHVKSFSSYHYELFHRCFFFNLKKLRFFLNVLANRLHHYDQG